MASAACCVYQISRGNPLKQQEPDRSSVLPTSGLCFRTWRFCSYNHRRLLLQSTSNSRNAASAEFRTIATTRDSEVDAEGGEKEGKKADEIKAGGELVNGEEADAVRPPKFKKKSLIHILETLHKQAIEAATKDREIPDLRPGYVVKVKVEVPDTKRRVSYHRGIVICRRNNGVNTTFTIRNIIAGVGVEMVFPLYSPIIKEITVLQKKKVRRAKLYYLRKKLPKFSTF